MPRPRPAPPTACLLLPAALLSQRQAWQAAAQALPSGSCLLICDPNHPWQRRYMVKLSRLFRRKGTRVHILEIEADRG